jgi:uncharacterized protein YeaO (DUF488 family)
MIKTKSVHSAIEPEDGLRVLVTRYRGRGLPRSRYDAWMANLAPSESLLSLLRSGRAPWPKFVRAYRAELADSATFDRRNPTIKNHGQKFTLRLLQQLGRRENVTLMCHCAEEEVHCHRHILAGILARKEI